MSLVRPVLLAAALCALAAPAAADAARFPPSTTLLSRSSAGGIPNGPSCCASVSRDERIARVIAFESQAGDIAPGTRRGTANIFVVGRLRPWTTTGSPWLAGPAYLVTRGVGGRRANGPSYAPKVSGDSAHLPLCVAFLSRASNLVHGDRNRRADAFVADLRSGRITRVSVGSAGQEADGSTTEVSVDGACSRVAFTSDATNLQPSARQAARRWPGARASAPARSTAQVYVHYLQRRGPRSRRLAGLTMLASRAAAGSADRPAAQLSLSSKGASIAFVSAAANLGAPTGGIAQVWEADISERLASRGRMRMAVRTRLVSRTPAGGGASGPSITPSIDHDGGTIAFATLAPELTGLPPSGVWQVVKLAPREPATAPTIISKSQHETRPPALPGNASSLGPQISEGGLWVFFDSRATNLFAFGHSEPQRQVWRWTDPSLRATADLSGLQLKSIAGPGTGTRTGSSTPSAAPASSARGNYMTFESEDPSLDYERIVRNGPPWVRTIAAARPYGVLQPGLPPGALRGLPGAGGTFDPSLPTAPADPRLHQVFLRYLGPQ